MRNFLFVLLCCLAACCPQQIALDSKWKPLVQIEQSKAVPVGTYSTTGNSIYTGDTCDWFKYPAEEQNGLLLHEQMHSIHQAQYQWGLAAWQHAYHTDVDFRWAEESAGWALELTYDAQHGVTIDIPKVAKFMNEAYNEGDWSHPIIGYDEALKWISGVIAKAKGQ